MARVDAVSYDHGAGLSLDFLGPEDRLMEVVHHDFRLGADGFGVAFDEFAEFSLCPLGIELGVVLDGLQDVEVGIDGGVVSQHVQDEAFLDGLLHGVGVEWQVLDGAVVLRKRFTEQLQGLVLGGGGEGEVAGVGE